MTKKTEKNFCHDKTDSVYPISILHAPVGVCKTEHSLCFIYWARSATLTALCSQFGNRYFQKNVLVLPIGKFPNPMKKEIFYFTEKKIFVIGGGENSVMIF